MGNGNGFTAQQLIDAINEAEGFVSKAASILKTSRKTFYVYLKKFPTAQQALEDVREARHDVVENKLLDKINKGDTTCIIFYLKTQAKHRGYIERQEHTHDGELKIKTVGFDASKL